MAKADAKEQDDEDNEAPAPAAKGGLKKILILVGSVFLLVGLSVGGTMFFTGALSAQDEGEEEATAEAKPDKKKKKTAKSGKKAKDEKNKTVFYLPLDPPFVVNFLDQGNLRYLQVSMEVMTHEQPMVEEIKKHMPAIRNNLLLLLSGQTFDSVGNRDGRENVRAGALSEIQKIMQAQTGKPAIEAVYFTSYVMQ